VARRITDPADLITGPLADGQVGDYLLANDVVRFIIQDAPKRDMYSVGCFGGNIIDAELIGHPGLDNFLELQPAVQIETVINAQTVEILNDGADGNPAVIRSCGPDDVLDFVNPSTIIEDIGGLTFPAEADDHDYDVEGCTEYSLELGKPYVKLVTTIFNNEDVDHGFFIGDYINASGQVEQWTSSGVGLGELLTSELGVMSYIGYGEATGVDYSHVTLPIPGSPMPHSSFFTAAGVSYNMQSNSVAGVIFGGPPTFFVPAHGNNSITRYFGVGDGSGANAISIEQEVKGLPAGMLRVRDRRRRAARRSGERRPGGRGRPHVGRRTFVTDSEVAAACCRRATTVSPPRAKARRTRATARRRSCTSSASPPARARSWSSRCPRPVTCR
jgi:hypothetical protein